MNSARKIISNQRNATRSTGPKTLSGKSKSALNAATHGLSGKFNLDEKTKKQHRELAKLFAGSHTTNSEIMMLAEAAAEAHIMVLRVKEARRRAWESSSESSAITGRGSLAILNDPVEARLFLRDSGFSASDLRKIMPGQFKEPFETDIERQAAILKEASKTLTKLLRYERKAINQRDRAFDKIEMLRDGTH